MSDLLDDLLNNAPDGVTVKDLGTNDRGDRIVQWWACDRFGISLRTGEGFRWAEGMEIVKDRSACGCRRTSRVCGSKRLTSAWRRPKCSWARATRG